MEYLARPFWLVIWHPIIQLLRKTPTSAFISQNFVHILVIGSICMLSSYPSCTSSSHHSDVIIPPIYVIIEVIKSCISIHVINLVFRGLGFSITNRQLHKTRQDYENVAETPHLGLW